MNVTTIRSFAAGIILAVTICGIVYFIEPNQATSTQVEEKPQVEELTDEDMKFRLAEKGYIIHTKDEWQKQKTAIETEAVKNTTESDTAKDTTTTEENPKKDGESSEQYRTIVTVTSGMTAIDVANQLKEANIIQNKMYFVKTVEKQGLAKKLKPGTFEINSNMTLQEILSAIF